jgi:hypothetical protein
MCNILILDNFPQQLGWIVDSVNGALKSVGKYRFMPDGLKSNRSMQIVIPPRPEPLNDTSRAQWVDQVLKNCEVDAHSKLDIAIVDLCLTSSDHLEDPEGIWVCSALRKMFPDCYIIMVSSKTVTDQPNISGGWFRHVQIPKARIDEVVGIRDDDLTSSRNRLQHIVRERVAECHLIAN